MLDGRVEQDRRLGFSFVVTRLADLRGALATVAPARVEAYAEGRTENAPIEGRPADDEAVG